VVGFGKVRNLQGTKNARKDKYLEGNGGCKELNLQGLEFATCREWNLQIKGMR